jgi:hypothetical protein
VEAARASANDRLARELDTVTMVDPVPLETGKARRGECPSSTEDEDGQGRVSNWQAKEHRGQQRHRGRETLEEMKRSG